MMVEQVTEMKTSMKGTGLSWPDTGNEREQYPKREKCLYVHTQRYNEPRLVLYWSGKSDESEREDEELTLHLMIYGPARLENGVDIFF